MIDPILGGILCLFVGAFVAFMAVLATIALWPWGILVIPAIAGLHALAWWVDG